MEQLNSIINILKRNLADSLPVQWLGLGSFTVGAKIQSLTGELRSCKMRGIAKKRNLILEFHKSKTDAKT